ncbi:ADP-ribosyltransferase [Aequorivita todarodis]|uniref:ADP-ribosyltransferase n=1 Tax=Aequorivita todarodis TaxID=2036821 RepID=UPI0023508ADC|nr:ADP-ribosyltransferase [Aequorivita todarodis]MDC8001973.1 ADP-ribosyltransferase [Aequorivita todarodis]
MDEMEKYVEKYLPEILGEILSTFRKNEIPELSNAEKALIYKYSDDEYEFVNQYLRINNGRLNDFGKLLDISLDKLPNYRKLCFRAVHLKPNELKKYIDAFESSNKIIEHSFLSCSSSRLIAMQFNHNVLFRIQSKKGKDIQKIAKFGIESGQNEKEILFKANTVFYVLDVRKENAKTLITLQEV